MIELSQSILESLDRLWQWDAPLMAIVGLSLRVSLTALAIAALAGIPLGAWLGLTQFRGRRAALALLYTGMGLPPVVVGLVVYLLLSRQGPLGGWERLFTPDAMILAQTVISLPIIAGTVMSAVTAVEPDLRRQLIALGATPARAMADVIIEARFGVFLALVAGFGRNIAEVGAVMLVGGNIEGSTRVLTTAIVLETRQGQFSDAIALGIVLLLLSFAVNWLLLLFQQRTGRGLRALHG